MSHLANAIKAAGMDDEEAADVRALIVKHDGDVKKGLRAYLDELEEDRVDLGRQLKEQGFDLAPRKLRIQPGVVEPPSIAPIGDDRHAAMREAEADAKTKRGFGPRVTKGDAAPKPGFGWHVRPDLKLSDHGELLYNGRATDDWAAEQGISKDQMREKIIGEVTAALPRQNGDQTNPNNDPENDWLTDFLKEYEGYEPKFVLDKLNKTTVTGGYGRDIGAGQTGRIGEAVDLEKATEWLRQDIAEKRADAEKLIVPEVWNSLSQRQRDAFTSLVFNMGPDKIVGSDTQKRINEGNFLDAANEWLEFRGAGGEINDGLMIRRLDEVRNFLGPLSREFNKFPPGYRDLPGRRPDDTRLPGLIDSFPMF